MSIGTFREWLRRKEEDNKLNELKEENARVWHIFESFDSHFEIQKIYRNESVNISFYNFKIRNFNYRIFIEQREDKIHIGFEKEDEFFMNKWKIDGIDDELKMVKFKNFSVLQYMLLMSYINKNLII